MINHLTTFPHEQQALDRSEKLAAIIKQEIQLNGSIPFVRFMECALYLPDLGYYSADLPKLGEPGDFTTAPEISPLYSKCIAKQCQEILAHCPGDILEIGAGTGVMAAEILLALEALQALPRHYYIFEISANLRQRQACLIATHIPHLKHKVIWLSSLANLTMQGIILANEIIDAFPIYQFKKTQGRVAECYVQNSEKGFYTVYAKPGQALQDYIDHLEIAFAEGYTSECNLYLFDWIKKLATLLNKGVILLMDYGFPRHEYYHPARNLGTLMCHYRHLAHGDPLIRVGLQDITTHVDFTAVAEAAIKSNLSVTGFVNQASFLLSCGIIEMLETQSIQAYSKLVNDVKILTSPNEMGELFKVMALTKNFDVTLLGFSTGNRCERLFGFTTCQK
jgi:SAM-dependent MidA family methyltransferase